LTDEANYAVGADAALLGRKQLTVSFEVVGQYLRDSVNAVELRNLAGRADVDDRFQPPEPDFYSVSRIFVAQGSLNVLRGAVGAKYQIGPNALVTGGMLLSLDGHGLRTDLTPYIGLDLSLSKR
jgi:hypothetical protein